MKTRIQGFDLARAYAIFGMFIVNFNMVMGSYTDTSTAGKLLALFSGNSSTVFVMLAGLGVALMSGRAAGYDITARRKLRSVVLKRAAFLFVLGLLLSLWWPADILHFYAVYMLLAIVMLFMPRRYYIWAAVLSVVCFHALLPLLPFETGWHFETLVYQDFWTITGFLRNLFYNGWNAVLPWFAYFATGMYLGRLDWTERRTLLRVGITGLCLFLAVNLAEALVSHYSGNADLLFFMQADYLPPFLPFILSTTGFGLMLIAASVALSRRFTHVPFLAVLAGTGRMTLTHYVAHLTLGMLLLAWITGRSYIDAHSYPSPLSPWVILAFSTVYFVLSCWFSKVWGRRFGNGPLELLMRRLSGA